LASCEPVARIDLSALEHNYAEVRRLVGPDVDILSMIKADGYGHGAVPAARTLSALGCRNFGVATLEEAAALGSAVGEAAVVVFGGIHPGAAARAVELGVEVVVFDDEVLGALSQAASAAGRPVRVHVKVDTGMHRLGLAPENVAEFVARARSADGVEPVALCSHFAMAESVRTDVTAGQFEIIEEVSADLTRSGVRLRRHLANSAAVITRPETHLDMVRPGLMLYGLYPDPAMRTVADLRPVMRLEASVVRIADVAAGEGVGYGHTYRTPSKRRIATIRCGYADGLPRAMSNKGTVVADGRTLPVVGRVCMDHTMVDATGTQLGPGDRVVLWGGDGLTAEEAANRIDTISYELVARVGPRVGREYCGGTAVD
jgi:alanine racemase